MKSVPHLTPLFIATLTGATLAAGCTAGPDRSPDVEQVVPVTLGRAEVAELPAFHEAGGIVRARSTAVISSRMMAPVAQVHVRPGDRVRRGAPLVTLDARENQAQRARSAASFVAAVEGARAADLEAQTAQANLTLARATHGRINTLFEKRSATPQERDQAVAALAAAEAQLGSARARVAGAHAARDAAQAGADAAEIAVSYGVLPAPFDGVVTDRSVDPGSMAAPGAPLLTVEDPSAYRLEVQIDEARAAGLEVGQAAEVRLDAAEGGAWLSGTIVERSRVDPGSHSFVVKVEIPVGPSIRSGLFGRARFTGQPRRTLTVPASALIRRGQLTFVYAVAPDGLARLRPVTTAGAGERVEVLAGLRDGERIVLTPPDSLVDGARVAPGETRASAGGAQ